MAAYSRVDDKSPEGVTACTPGSAPGPTLGNEYGKPVPFTPSRLKAIISGELLLEIVGGGRT